MRKIDILLFLVFAVMASWQDIRYRGVPVWLLASFACIALVSGIALGRMPACLSGTVAGFGILLISHFTRGAIGSGDGWFFVVCGLILPPSKIFLILCASVSLSGIFSLVIFAERRIKNGYRAGSDTLPFIPFAAAAGALVIAAGLG